MALARKLDARLRAHRQHLRQDRRPGVRRRRTQHLQLMRAHIADLAAAMKQVHVAEELQHEGRGRVVIDLVGRADLLDAAFVHDDDAVGNFHRFFLVVRDEDAGQMHLVVQAPQPAPQLLAHLGVERAEGLVEQQYLGLHRQRAGQCDALALAAGELRRVAVRQPVELHELQQLHHLVGDLRVARPLAPRLDTQAEGHVLEDRHVVEQRVVLEDEADLALAHVRAGRVFAVEQHLPGVGHFEPGHDAQQRRLARTRRPEQRHQFARGNGEVQVVADDGLAERLLQVADFDAHRCSFIRCSTKYLPTSVSSASPASSDATAKAAANWYSL